MSAANRRLQGDTRAEALGYADPGLTKGTSFSTNRHPQHRPKGNEVLGLSVSNDARASPRRCFLPRSTMARFEARALVAICRTKGQPLDSSTRMKPRDR